MKIDYLNPLQYYYESLMKPVVSPVPIRITKDYRTVEPIENGKPIDRYA